MYNNWYAYISLCGLRILLIMVSLKEDVRVQTDGVAPSSKKYKNWDDAVKRYKEKYEKGECQVKRHK